MRRALAWGAGIAALWAGVNVALAVFAAPVAGIVNAALALIVAVVAAVFASQIPTSGAGPVSAYDKNGMALAEAKEVDYHAETKSVGLRAVLMGAMPAKIYLRPEEIWKLLGMLKLDLLVRLPGVLLKGRADFRARQAPPPADQARD